MTEALERMLTGDNEVEIQALARAGWTISVISRHTGRDRKTVRRVPSGNELGRTRPPSVLEPYRAYITARLDAVTGDPHADASVLLREPRALGFDRSYPTLTRELHRLALRPDRLGCSRASAATIEILHPPGDELQLVAGKGPLQTVSGEPAASTTTSMVTAPRVRTEA